MLTTTACPSSFKEICMNGLVKWFNEKRGYGFLTSENGIDYFFHFSSICKEGHKTVFEDQRVSFDEGENDKGKCATNIKIIDE